MCMCVCVCVCVSHSVMFYSATPCIVICQAPLPMEFSRQENWSGLPSPSPGNLPNPGIKPWTLAFQVDSLPSETPEKPSGRFITRYFILLDAMINGIVSLISLPDFSLLVYRNVRDFCVLVLYLVTLPNSLMSSSSFLCFSFFNFPKCMYLGNKLCVFVTVL